MMNRLLLPLALAAAIAFAPRAEAETTLIFATASPPQGTITTEIFQDWTARINADGKGVVQIDMRPGFTLANPGNFYDRVKDGVVPVGWGIMTMVGGRFPLTSVVELPFLTGDAEPASVAFWRLYAEGALEQEYHDIVPLFLVAFPQSGIHLRAPLSGLNDLGGSSVISGSRTNASVVRALGGTPLSINPADAYEAIQRGTADGRLVPWTAFQPFRMDEITFYHIEAPLGTAVGMVFMNRSVWNGLPEAAREIIMRHSGEAQTRRLAQFFRGQDQGIRARIAGKEGHTIVSPDAAQLEAWRGRIDAVRAEWLAATPGGAEFLARYEALLKDAAQ